MRNLLKTQDNLLEKETSLKTFSYVLPGTVKSSLDEWTLGGKRHFKI